MYTGPETVKIAAGADRNANGSAAIAEVDSDEDQQNVKVTRHSTTITAYACFMKYAIIFEYHSGFGIQRTAIIPPFNFPKILASL